jgi:RNA polymerase sigma factor (sigma-70 family)
MTPRPQTVLGCLRAADGATDADLLDRFARVRDEAAFELLVWRHAGMVLRACHSVLRDRHDAEDACQTAFLALARQARAVGRRGTVAGWLYTVGRRIAARAARQRKDPTTTSDGIFDHLPAPPTEPGPDPDAVQLLFDELDRLPDKYRAPILLCFLDGLSHADAARRLGVPTGTVAGRVARAKERLCRRLTGRGVAVPAAGLGFWWRIPRSGRWHPRSSRRRRGRQWRWRPAVHPKCRTRYSPWREGRYEP